jgi:hypothetical protein
MSLATAIAVIEAPKPAQSDAAAVAPTPAPDAAAEPAQDWRTAMERFSRRQLALLRRHPWVTQIPLAGPPITPSQVGWMEYGLRSMAGTGLTEGEKIQVLGLISLYVRNEAKLEYDMAQAQQAAAAAAEATGGATLQAGPGAYGQVGPASYGQLLRRLIDPTRYPALMAVVESGAFEEAPGYADEDFEFGLQRLLDGVAALIDSRQDPAPKRSSRSTGGGRSGPAGSAVEVPPLP